MAGLHLLRPGLLARLDLAVYDRLLAASPLRAPSGRVALEHHPSAGGHHHDPV